MKILGIHDGHTASAALVVDGKVVAALQEERLRMEKNWNGFPTQSIEAIFKMAGVKAEEVDFLAYNGYHIPPGVSRDEGLEARRRNTGWYGKMLQLTRQTPIMTFYKNHRREKRLENAAQIGFPEQKVVFVEHHMAHAAAAYYGWGRYDEPILVLTADGAGDELCASVNIGRDGKLERIASVGRSESLGSIYSTITFLLGMVPLEHEYKLMGLAPYADEKRGKAVADVLFEYMPLPAEGSLTWQRGPGKPPAPICYPYLRKHLEFHRFDSIAAGVQLYTEQMLARWVQNAIRHTGIRKLALSGGVFMNVKANKLIMEMPEVDDLFVYPSCGDETNAMGAAYWVEAECGGSRYIPPIEAFYYGAAFDPHETQAAIEKRSAGRSWTVQQIADIDLHIADLLAQGDIVARARGPMEFGARALGNRSILADPTVPRVVETINYMVKQRDFWMPFAPMILDTRASDYLINPKNIRAPYMILSFDTPPEVRDQMTAAIHPYDRTARPQVLEEKHNPEMYRLLKRFEEKTGRGVILNTSFNLHGFPIVGTPDAAIDVFEQSGLPHLALGDYLMSKNEQP
ncbi:MAG: carbamoyltransferase [Anaerolineae bacterium]|nr:carbamoyltransferase [Anaerolineae bacterium]